MATSDLIKTLRRTDPIENLVQYTNEVKPYHSKLLDTFVEYIYGEEINVTINDSADIGIGLENIGPREKCALEVKEQKHIDDCTGFDKCEGYGDDDGFDRYFHKVLVFDGLHIEKFLPGYRFLGIRENGQAGVHIVRDVARFDSVDANGQKSEETHVLVGGTVLLDPENPIIVAHPSYIPEYRIVGSEVGVGSGYWIIAGNSAGEFFKHDIIAVAGVDGVYKRDVANNTLFEILDHPLTEQDPYTGEVVTRLLVKPLTLDRDDVNVLDPWKQASHSRYFTSGILKVVPRVYKQENEPDTNIDVSCGTKHLGAIWIKPSNNAQRILTAGGWIALGTEPESVWEGGSLLHDSKLTIVKINESLVEGIGESVEVDILPALVKNDHPVVYEFVHADVQGKRLRFVETVTRGQVTVDREKGAFTLVGGWFDLESEVLRTGEKIRITDHVDHEYSGEYTVRSVERRPGLNITIVYVKERIEALSGDLSLTFNAVATALPNWVDGSKIAYETEEGEWVEGYFIPQIEPFDDGTIKAAGEFGIAKFRKPTTLADFISFADFNSPGIKIRPVEIFTPGNKIVVENTRRREADGVYTVLRSEPVYDGEEYTGRERVYFQEPFYIPDGMTSFVGQVSFSKDTFTYNRTTSAMCGSVTDPLHTRTFIHDFVEFEFGIDVRDHMKTGISEHRIHECVTKQTIGGFGVGPYDQLGTRCGQGYSSNFVVQTEVVACPSYIASSFDEHSYGSTSYDHARIVQDGWQRHHGVPYHSNPTLSVVPMGFDTQFFDVGGIDETVGTLNTQYGMER